MVASARLGSAGDRGCGGPGAGSGAVPAAHQHPGSLSHSPLWLLSASQPSTDVQASCPLNPLHTHLSPASPAESTTGLEEMLAPGVLSEHPNLASPSPLSVAISPLGPPATRWRHLDNSGAPNWGSTVTGSNRLPTPPHPQHKLAERYDPWLGLQGWTPCSSRPASAAKLKRDKKSRPAGTCGARAGRAGPRAQRRRGPPSLCPRCGGAGSAGGL